MSTAVKNNGSGIPRFNLPVLQRARKKGYRENIVLILQKILKTMCSNNHEPANPVKMKYVNFCCDQK
jgi:hypothetical protein